MASSSSRKTFINLPVRDLKRSMDFFAKLGFEFNPKFTDDNAACMIISQEAYAMLLREPFFKGFTKREICQTSTHTETLVADFQNHSPRVFTIIHPPPVNLSRFSNPI